ncbi:hypothetical protein Tco_1211895 [Tanacetum coccineum]
MKLMLVSNKGRFIARKDKSSPPIESWSPASLSRRQRTLASSRVLSQDQAPVEWSRQDIVRLCQAANPRGRQDPPYPRENIVTFSFHCLAPLNSCLRLFPPSEESDNLNILDAEPVDPVLEASSLPKFEMHMYKSSLTETNVKWLTKRYGIPADIHPRVVPEGMTMDALPNDAIGIYAHHFQQGGLRVPFSAFFLKVVEYFCVHISQLVPLGVNRTTYFEMYFHSLNITPIVPLFCIFYKLCKQGNWFSFQNRVVDRRDAPTAMAWRHHDSSVADPFPKPSEFDASDVAKLHEVVIVLRKPPPSLLYAAGLSHAWKHAGRSYSLKDPNGKGYAFVLSVTGDMETTEIPCRKVLDDKKKKKAEAKAAANAPDADIHVEKVASKRCAGKEGAFQKRRKVHLETLVHPDSEHVSSPVPLNHVKPLKAFANEEHVSTNTSASRMNVLRTQTDEHVIPCPAVNVDELVLGEEKSQENVDVAFVNEGHNDKIVPDAEANSCRMDNSRSCRDMMSNLFTPTDTEFFNEGVRDESAIKRSWKLLCQSAQQQASALLRFEALTEEHANLVYARESCKDMKVRYKESKKELASLQSAFDEKVYAYGRLSKDYDYAPAGVAYWLASEPHNNLSSVRVAYPAGIRAT